MLFQCDYQKGCLGCSGRYYGTVDRECLSLTHSVHGADLLANMISSIQIRLWVG